jgi:hypothetical protein
VVFFLATRKLRTDASGVPNLRTHISFTSSQIWLHRRLSHFASFKFPVTLCWWPDFNRGDLNMGWY